MVLLQGCSPCKCCRFLSTCCRFLCTALYCHHHRRGSRTHPATRVCASNPPPRPGTALSNYLGFVDFIINMAPGVLMAAVACIPLILFLYRHTLVPPIQRYQAMLEEVRLPWRRLPTLPGR